MECGLSSRWCINWRIGLFVVQQRTGSCSLACWTSSRPRKTSGCCFSATVTSKNAPFYATKTETVKVLRPKPNSSCVSEWSNYVSRNKPVLRHDFKIVLEFSSLDLKIFTNDMWICQIILNIIENFMEFFFCKKFTKLQNLATKWPITN